MPTSKKYNASILSMLDDTLSFSNGLNPARWRLMKKNWGAGWGGCVPENVGYAIDAKNGNQPVVVLTIQGDLNTTGVRGIQRNGPPNGGNSENTSTAYWANTLNSKRVGAAILTNEYYASGEYEVKMRLGWADGIAGKKAVGYCPAAWTFHYEIHSASSTTTAGVPNPADLRYQSNFSIASEVAGAPRVSTVNHEIDFPELGRTPAAATVTYPAVPAQGTGGGYVSWITALEAENRAFTSLQLAYKVGANAQNLAITKNAVNGVIDCYDDEYHTYTMRWETELVEVASVVDSDLTAATDGSGYFYLSNVAKAQLQVKASKDTTPGTYVWGFPWTKKPNGVWAVYLGRSIKYYLDGYFLREATKLVPSISGRLIIGGWFPRFATTTVPNWSTAKMYIASVKIKPYFMEGDVFYQSEDFPMDGIAEASKLPVFNPISIPRAA